MRLTELHEPALTGPTIKVWLKPLTNPHRTLFRNPSPLGSVKFKHGRSTQCILVAIHGQKPLAVLFDTAHSAERDDDTHFSIRTDEATNRHDEGFNPAVFIYKRLSNFSNHFVGVIIHVLLEPVGHSRCI